MSHVLVNNNDGMAMSDYRLQDITMTTMTLTARCQQEDWSSNSLLCSKNIYFFVIAINVINLLSSKI